METALHEAKALVQRMETFLDENESSVKKFLEDQKNEVMNLSRPRVMLESYSKVAFDESNMLGEGTKTNQDDDIFGDEIIEIGVSPRVDNTIQYPKLEVIPALVDLSS